MRIIIPGHDYEVNDTQGNPCNTLNFINKSSTETLEGTTNEEVLDVLIDRMNFLNNLLPCKENGIIIHHLQQARLMIDERSKDRERRGVKGKLIK